MTTSKHITSQQNHIDLTNHAVSVLNLFFKEIKVRFANHPICLMEYHEKGAYEKTIEIRFDPEQASLSCILNEEKICDIAYLFFDNHLTVGNYIQYLNENFTYDYLTAKWSISDWKISIKRVDGVTCFCFSSIR